MTSYGATHKGLVRATNQDSYQIVKLTDTATLLLVCDGMGGQNAGNVASQLAAEEILAGVKVGFLCTMSQEELKALLISAFRQANARIVAEAADNPDYYGMGTTAVAAIVTGSYAVVANVGDSRAYHFSGGGNVQITKDHSIVQEMFDNGRLSEEEARHHPKKNIITRALGISSRCEIDTFEAVFCAGDMLLLCSDGLSNLVEPKELAASLTARPFSQMRVDELIELANSRGGNDNSTAVVAQV